MERITCFIFFLFPKTQGVGSFEFSVQFSQVKAIRVFSKTDTFYEPFFIIATPERATGFRRIEFKKTDGVRNYYLCEVEVLGGQLSSRLTSKRLTFRSEYGMRKISRYSVEKFT